MTIQAQLLLPLSHSAFVSAFVPDNKIEWAFIYKTREHVNP